MRPILALLPLVISTAILVFVGCGRAGAGSRDARLAEGGVQLGSLPGWTVRDGSDDSIPGTPVVNGLPLDSPRAIFVSPDGKMGFDVIVVDQVLTEKRQRKWGLIHRNMQEAVAAEFEERLGHPLSRDVEQLPVKLANGVSLPFTKTRILPGTLAGDDVVWGLGFVVKNGKILIVNLGCATPHYSAATVYELVGSLTWTP